MDLTIQQLRMLREVDARGTIAAAADSLGYTPSAVSQQLAGIQKATGVAVLERIGRSVRLTDPGRELVRHADAVLAQIELAQVAMERVVNHVAGDLLVGVFGSVASTLLGPVLDLVQRRHPDLTVRTRQADPEPGLAALAKGDLDVTFVIDYPHAPIPEPAGIERLSVKDDRFHLVVAENDPLRDDPVELAAIANRPIIAEPPGDSCGRCVVVACNDAGFDPDIRHQLVDYPTVLQLVAAGHGVALIPDLGLVQVPPGVRVLRIEPVVRRSIQLAHRTVSHDRPAVVAFRQAVVDVLAGHRDRRSVQAPGADLAV